MSGTINVGSLIATLTANTAPLRVATAQATKVLKQYSKTVVGQNKIAADAFTAMSTKATRSFGDLRKAILGVSAVLVVRKIITMADEYRLINARLNLVTKSTLEFNTAQKEAFRIAQGTRQSYYGTATLMTKMARATESLGMKMEDMAKVSETVNKAIAISGSTAQEAASSLLQFGQALASNRLSGDELRSILEQTPRLGVAIAHGMGYEYGALKALGEAGLLTTKVVIEALQKSAGEIAKEFLSIPVTVGQSFQQTANSILRFVGEIDQRINFSSTIAKMVSGFSALLDATPFDLVADAINKLVGAFTTLLKIVVVGGSLYAGFIATQGAVTGITIAMSALSKATAAAATVWAQWTFIASATGLVKVTKIQVALYGVTDTLRRLKLAIASSGGTFAALNTMLYGVSVSALLAAGSITKLQLAFMGLGVFVAGFMIGEYLTKEFDSMKGAAEEFRLSLVEAWESIAASFKILLIPIKSAWQGTLNFLTRRYADFIEGVGQGVSVLPFGGNTGAGMIASAVKVRAGITPVASGQEQIDKIRTEMQKVIADYEAYVNEEALRRAQAKGGLAAHGEATIAAAQKYGRDDIAKTAAAKKLITLQEEAVRQKIAEIQREKEMLSLSEAMQAADKDAIKLKIAKGSEQYKNLVIAYQEFYAEKDRLKNLEEMEAANKRMAEEAAKAAKQKEEDYAKSIASAQLELQLLGQKQAVQNAMSEAARQGFEVGSAQYNTLLGLYEEIEARKQLFTDIEAQIDAYAELYQEMMQIESDRKQSFSDLIKEIELEIEMVGKSAKEQRLAQLSIQYGIKETSAEYRKLIELITELENRQKDATTGMKSAWQDYVEDANDHAKKMKEVMSSVYKGLEDALVEFVRTGKLSLKELGLQIAEMIVRMAAQSAVMAAFGGGFAKGGVFAGGGVVPFASGGVVDGPTVFPMSGGRTGLMGEAGPEAVMPLRRDSKGRLGVEASGGGGNGHNIQITQNFHFDKGVNEISRATVMEMLPELAEMSSAKIRDDLYREGVTL